MTASPPQSPRPLQTLKEALGGALALSSAGGRFLRNSQLLRECRPGPLLSLSRQIQKGLRGPMAVVRLHAMAAPERPALVSLPGGDGMELRLSYGELDARTLRLCRGLHRLGVRPGDRVGVLLDNGHEFIETVAALGYLGATCVQIGYRLKPGEVAYILQHAGVTAFLFHGAHGDVAREALALSTEAGLKTPACVVAGGSVSGAADYEELASFGPALDPPYAAGGQASLMLYTSGTTGRSKGARRDLSRTSFASVLAMLGELPLRRDDRHLVCCPLYHAAAPAFAAFVLGAGGCLVIPRHFDPAAVPALIERERVTSTLVVPTMLGRLLQHEEALRRHDLSSLGWVMSAAAPLPTDLARRVEERLGPVLYNMYGATETGLVTLARPGEHTARPGTIGRAIPGNDLRLLDGQGRQVPEGEVGELYVKNGTLVSGYHNDAEATRSAMRQGYFSVGDLAYRDADGYYYLADRKSDMVISGGVNIYPLEIEQRLHHHPAVADCAVVGAPDPDWGESLCAFVVAASGAEPGPALGEALGRFVTEALADYKRPRRVLFVDSIPRNPTGKIEKRTLRQWAETAAAQAPAAKG